MPTPSLFTDVLSDDLEGWSASDIQEEMAPLGGLFDDEEELDFDVEEAFGACEAPFGFCGEVYGRRARAQKVRKQLTEKGSAAEAWNAGYAQALKDNSLPPRPGSEAFGSIWSELASGMLEGATGGKGLQEVTREATEGAMSRDPSSWRITKWLRGAGGEASVEQDAEVLPPVYVADPEGFDAELEAADGFQQSDLLQSEESFGAAAREGFLGPQRREQAAQAAQKAAAAGARRLRAASYGLEQPFLEDPTAEPVLFSDGSLWDVVYGQLHAVPCPSCARAGVPGDCVACDDYGAILVPDVDIEPYVAMHKGRLVQFTPPSPDFDVLGSDEGLFTSQADTGVRALVPEDVIAMKVF